jgi:hypothetical protein
MASNDYQGSIAQQNVNFITQTVVTTTPGDNYYKLMVFVSVADSTAFFAAGAQVSGYTVTVTSANYNTIVAGQLLKWLGDFFTGNQISQVILVVYTNSADLTTQYNTYKAQAYFKMTAWTALTTSPTNPDTALAALIKAEGKDKKLSQQWISTSDLTGAIATTLKGASEDAVVVYHPDTNRNPAMLQLGISLEIANSTGTPVGNKLNYLQTNLIGASGYKTITCTTVTSSATVTVTTGTTADLYVGQTVTGTGLAPYATVQSITDSTHFVMSAQAVSGTAGTVITYPMNINLSSTDMATLSALNIAYFTTIGNSTGYVAMQGYLSTLSNYPEAMWIRDYIDYTCEIYTAQIITSQGAFKNNTQYQLILGILAQQLNLFVALGRLSNQEITAPIFNKLPSSSGTTITIPNAWQANFNANLITVNVYGTLYISL